MQTALPAPYDRHYGFQPIFFRPGGEPCMGGETDSPEDSFIREDPDDLAVHQIVPWGGNPYVQYFGGWGSAGDGRWEAPEDTLYNLAVWIGGGGKVVVHRVQPHVPVVGDGQGRSRFLYGGGMRLFVAREMGVLPLGVVVGGQAVGGMALVWGVEFPLGPGSMVTYHLVPPRCLSDLPYPGLPTWVSPYEEFRWLPPPPVFGPGDPVWGRPDLVQARVGHSVSIKEVEEEGGGVVFVGVLRRGSSYLRLIGLQ